MNSGEIDYQEWMRSLLESRRIRPTTQYHWSDYRFVETIKIDVNTTDELFSLYVKEEIDETTYQYNLPLIKEKERKLKLTPYERVIEHNKNKPKIKDKVRLKSWWV